MTERPGQSPKTADPDARRDADPEEALTKDLPAVTSRKVFVVVGVLVAVLGLLFLLGFVPERRRKAAAAAQARRAGSQQPVVNVVRPTRQPKVSELVLPGNAVALQTTLIFPRTNGYLKELRADIGDRVEAGQLLAVIDTPEIDAQLAQARAAVQQAQANIAKSRTDLDFNQATLTRFEGYFKSGGVTQQQLDQTRNQFNAAKAALDLANASLAVSQANVQQLEALQGFEKVVAPFKGTITTRNYDLGALLSATPAAGAREMFRIDRTDTLRIFVDVPQGYASLVKLRQSADFLVRDYPGRAFTGKVSRSADAIDPVTRTERFQVEVPNGDDLLTAGMYGQMRFNLVQEQPPLLVPASALVYNAQGLRLAVVSDGKVHLQPVTTGRDLGTEVEIIQGLHDFQDVVSNPGQRMVEGAAVQVASSPQPADAPKPGVTEASAR
jgi:RND family efflux transporter MFP subunit